jgi:cytochrome P450
MRQRSARFLGDPPRLRRCLARQDDQWWRECSTNRPARQQEGWHTLQEKGLTIVLWQSDAMRQAAMQTRRIMPPGPKGRLLVGNALDFSRGDWFGFFIRCAREYGDVVSFRFLNVPMCLLTHPDDIEDVLVRNAPNFVKSRNYHVLKLVLGNGLLTSEGRFWQRQRKLAQPSFRHDSIARYAEVMVDSARQMLHGWRDGQTRDVHEEMMAVTLAVVAKSLFGADVSGEAHNVGHALR